MLGCTAAKNEADRVNIIDILIVKHCLVGNARGYAYDGSVIYILYIKKIDKGRNITNGGSINNNLYPYITYIIIAPRS